MGVPQPEPGAVACLAIFVSGACWCGRGKQPRHAVCAACWRKLDDKQKDSLYLMIGNGFEEAYERVIEHLRHHTHGPNARGKAARS